MKISVLALVLLLTAALVAPSAVLGEPPGGFGDSGEWREALDVYLDGLGADNKVMSLSIAVSEKGKVVYQNAVGYSDYANLTSADDDTRYRIGSITKTFTAVMILQLIEKGQLSLNTKLSDFYPQVPNSQIITIEEMLSHRSGIFDITNDPWHQTVFTKFRTKEENIAVIAGYPSVFEPGSQTQYSNSNYILLGYILEDVTGKSYGENLEFRLTRKLQMHNTLYGLSINPAIGDAYPYVWTPTGWKLAPIPDLSIPVGAGAISSTPSELIRLVHGLFSNGSKLLKKDTLSMMTTIVGGWGMGITTLSYPVLAYGHPGSMPGFWSIIAYVPERDIALAISTNGLKAGVAPKDIWTAVLDIILGQ